MFPIKLCIAPFFSLYLFDYTSNNTININIRINRKQEEQHMFMMLNNCFSLCRVEILSPLKSLP